MAEPSSLIFIIATYQVTEKSTLVSPTCRMIRLRGIKRGSGLPNSVSLSLFVLSYETLGIRGNKSLIKRVIVRGLSLGITPLLFLKKTEVRQVNRILVRGPKDEKHSKLSSLKEIKTKIKNILALGLFDGKHSSVIFEGIEVSKMKRILIREPSDENHSKLSSLKRILVREPSDENHSKLSSLKEIKDSLEKIEAVVSEREGE
ncbi:hypothetical protein SK128_013986 [Halocaridina rubra]|uniref:Uncharacterized protein n=1 Tax=Halocaridina rubra TaxID=373956 RepID=A0AAN8ZRW9_HALRR